ncbi:MAG: glutamate 5-kinase [Acutalibacteraceae bacterium]|nr:glutamate 5-kinase [Acutalibacteraceae bacterium]
MRIVLKVGTSTLTHATGRLNIRRVEKLCKVLSDLKNSGNEIIMVSSGAIGMGVGKLSLKSKPDDIESKQAAAAIGQCELMYIYDKLFSEYHHIVAQILLTNDDFNDKTRKVNFRNTVKKLLEFGAIPIVNENDTVVTDEIAVGDNDTLGAKVAVETDADLLIVLSDIDGLYTADPHTDKNAKLITKVESLNADIIALGKGTVTSMGTGGMKTKLSAAKLCLDAGFDMVIANGKEPDILYDIMDGKPVGTRFCAK